MFTCAVSAQVDHSHNTFFNTDKYDLTAKEEAQLSRFISSLPKDSIQSISIYGYCDDRGTNDYNRKLSQRRADAIRAIFVREGVEDSIIKNSDGKGELLLTTLDDMSTKVQRRLNRKAEIIAAIKSPKEVTPALKDSEKESETPKKRYKNFEDTPFVKGDRILLKNILFKTNYSYVHGSSYKDLKKIAQYLKKHPEIIFKIQGHVCCVNNGRDGIDLKTGKRNLSKARAQFIYKYLADHGVAKKRMRYEGFGSRFPLGGDLKDDKRVEILVTYVKKTKSN